MSDIIKVKITNCKPSTWYKVGDVVDVEKVPKKYSDDAVSYMGYPLKGNWYACVNVLHCEIIQPTLQDLLQAAKDNVAELEKQLAEEAKLEAERPFTQEDYERVVKQYRACKGRSVFHEGDNNFCVEITTESVHTDSWNRYLSVAPFGVFFSTDQYVDNAIAEVGENNLRKAWAYEMGIGLPTIGL